MRLFLELLLTVGVLILGVSCDQNTVFNDYSPIEKPGWSKDSVKIFSVRITDTVASHRIYINLRNRTNYYYSNIWLFIGIQSPGGEFLKDTVQFILADPSGRWTGKGFGGIKDNRFLFRNNVYFPRSGSYLFTLQQGMRQDILTGISDAGFRIEKR